MCRLSSPTMTSRLRRAYRKTVTRTEVTTHLPLVLFYITYIVSSFEHVPSGLITNKFQNGTADPFSSEEGFQADTIALAAYYPPPAPTLVIPLRIDFFTNAKEVNVGHFDNVSMVKDNGTSVPLLQQIAMGLPMKPMAMKMINYTSDKVRTAPHSSSLIALATHHIIVSEA